MCTYIYTRVVYKYPMPVGRYSVVLTGRELGKCRADKGRPVDDDQAGLPNPGIGCWLAVGWVATLVGVSQHMHMHMHMHTRGRLEQDRDDG